MTETQGHIFDQMHLALANCGATSDLLCISGSFGDTLDDETVLSMLQDWNADAEATPSLVSETSADPLDYSQDDLP